MNMRTLKRPLSIAPWICLISCLSARLPASAEPPVADEQYRQLVQRYEQTGGSRELTSDFLSLAQAHADQPVAVDALGWVAAHGREPAQQATAVELLEQNYLNSVRLAGVVQNLKRPTPAAEELLRAILKNSSRTETQVHACLRLADLLQQQLQLKEKLAEDPRSRRRFEQYYGKPFMARLAKQDPEALTREIEGLYERLVDRHATVNPRLTEQARSKLVELRHLTVGRPAMEIEGVDLSGESFKLSDYRGKVVVLTFWGHW